MISSAALTTACAPEPQTRFTVIAGTLTGRPPPIAAWRDGFILLPAWITWPNTSVSTSAGDRPPRLSASATTTAPSAVAGVPLSVPL